MKRIVQKKCELFSLVLYQIPGVYQMVSISIIVIWEGEANAPPVFFLPTNIF